MREWEGPNSRLQPFPSDLPGMVKPNIFHLVTDGFTLLFVYWMSKFYFHLDTLKAGASAGDTQAIFKSTHRRLWSPSHGNATQRWDLSSSSPPLSRQLCASNNFVTPVKALVQV